MKQEDRQVAASAAQCPLRTEVTAHPISTATFAWIKRKTIGFVGTLD
jgi:hypothetical protein